MKKHLVINSKIRFTIFLSILMIISVISLNSIIGNKALGSTENNYITVEVCSGDSIWNIAETYIDTDKDIREAVYMICDINDISADELKVGMSLKVPKYM